jgi:transcriptional regulator with XRE-family HTH domain
MKNSEEVDTATVETGAGGGFYSRLDEVRSRMGMTAYAFAIHCGVTDTAMRKYLSGAALPGLQALGKIARATDVSLDWFVLGSTAAEDPIDEKALQLSISFAADALLSPYLPPAEAPPVGTYELLAEYAAVFYRNLKRDGLNNPRSLEDLRTNAEMLRKVVLRLRKERVVNPSIENTQSDSPGTRSTAAD